MAKVPFNKLGLKKKDEVSTIKIGETEVEVKQYLPVDEKLTLISKVLVYSTEDSTFLNPVKVEVYGILEMIYAYTNLSFTEKQKEKPDLLFDLLEQNGITNEVIKAIPKVEYEYLTQSIDETVKAFYDYKNSLIGVLETISGNAEKTQFNLDDLITKIDNAENIGLLKDIITKLD